MHLVSLLARASTLASHLRTNPEVARSLTSCSMILLHMLSKTAQLHRPLHYLDFGGIGLPLLCVHGLGGCALNWMAVGDHLAHRWHVLAIDLPGAGLTPLDGGTADIDECQVAVNLFIRDVVGSPCVLLGSSMGALVTVLQAARHPQTVRGLVLVDPALPLCGVRRFTMRVAVTFAALLVPGLVEWTVTRRYRRHGIDVVVSDVLSLVYVDPSRLDRQTIDAHVDLARSQLDSGGWGRPLTQGARSYLAKWLMRPRRQQLWSGLRVPILVVHGEKDRVVPLWFAEQLATRYGWQLEVVADVGHAPMLEAPDAFLGVTEPWLDEISRCPGPLP